MLGAFGHTREVRGSQCGAFLSHTSTLYIYWQQRDFIKSTVARSLPENRNSTAIVPCTNLAPYWYLAKCVA